MCGNRTHTTFVLALFAAACGRGDARPRADSLASAGDSVTTARADSIAREKQDSINRAQPGYIIDSILPVEEELRRFRADIPGAPSRLVDAADSRDALVAAFLRAVEARDRAALTRLALTRAEFAYLVYPGSTFTAPPYRQAPGLVWMHIQRGSAAGVARLIERFGGRPLRLAGYRCDPQPERQGANSLWTNCALRLTPFDSASARSMRLFGTVIQRAGRFKFVGYANDL